MLKYIRKSRALLHSLSSSQVTDHCVVNKNAIAVSPPTTIVKAIQDLNLRARTIRRGEYFFLVHEYHDIGEYVIIDHKDPGNLIRVSAAIFTVVPKQPAAHCVPLDRVERNSQCLSISDAISGSSKSWSGTTVSATERTLSSSAWDNKHDRIQELHGVILYDFAAELPGELSATAGEDILIIAMVNDDWLVVHRHDQCPMVGLVPRSWVGIKHNGEMGPTHAALDVFHNFCLPVVGGPARYSQGKHDVNPFRGSCPYWEGS